MAVLLESNRSHTALYLGVASVLFVLYQAYNFVARSIRHRNFSREHGCKPIPAYPDRDPVLGLGFAFAALRSERSKTFLQGTEDHFKKYGNTYSAKLMGTSLIITCEPENVKTVLSLRFSDFNLSLRRKNWLTPLLGKGIFTTDGEDWGHSRAMLRPSFTRSQVADLPLFEKHVQHLIEAIPKNHVVDLQDLFFALTLDSATEFLFGESANTLPSYQVDSTGTMRAVAATATTTSGTTPEGLAFGDSFNFCTGALGSSLRFGVPFAIKNKAYRNAKATIHSFADYYVDKAINLYRSEKLAVPTDRYVFLHELVKETQDPTILRAEALNILLAGRDTTASLLSNLFNILSKRPDAWSKLQDEIAYLNGRAPSFEEIKNLVYLRYCLNEALRLWPVVPGNGRVAIRDSVLPRGGGPDGTSPVLVPKGTVVSYSSYSMHRREDIYGPDAAEFNPDRWDSLRPGWAHLPFNGGPRICLGQQFALLEASYTTIRIMQHFKGIESHDSNPWTELLTVTCTSGHGAKVVLKP
ncbi:hypothetical protein FQN57_005569 [Myotisia sp. PD_48]|nr:hypothetical protein FQN57_005569 [Myotisia sp. PD_48]